MSLLLACHGRPFPAAKVHSRLLVSFKEKFQGLIFFFGGVFGWNRVEIAAFRAGKHVLCEKPMAIDLSHISAPPDDLFEPAFGPDMRDAIPAGARWLESITIE